MANKPYFITIEGVEGAGKSTAIGIVADYLETKQIPHILTREPGGTEISEQIRQILLDHHHEKMAADTELLLMFASRAQHLATKIIPALTHGKWVICDRFTDASYAYQGAGRDLPIERVAILETWVQQDLRPDLTIILDLDPAVGLKRAKNCGELDRIESEEIAFFTKVRQCYLDRAKAHPNRYHIVDASQELEQVKNDIESILSSI